MEELKILERAHTEPLLQGKNIRLCPDLPGQLWTLLDEEAISVLNNYSASAIITSIGTSVAIETAFLDAVDDLVDGCWGRGDSSLLRWAEIFEAAGRKLRSAEEERRAAYPATPENL